MDNEFWNRLSTTMALYDSNINSMWNLSLKLGVNVKATSKKPQHTHLNNVQLHHALSLTDIQIGLKYITAASALKDNIGGGYFARILCISCCSLLKAKKGLKISSMNQYLKNSKTKPIALEIQNMLLKIEYIKAQHLGMLENIRDKIGAHKDGGGFVQMERMNKVDMNRVADISQHIFNMYYEMSPKIHLLEKALRG